MCGIAGIVSPDHDEGIATRLPAMIALLRHRGPDASGTHIEPGVALAHTRLSVIDVDGGAQPMALTGFLAPSISIMES